MCSGCHCSVDTQISVKFLDRSLLYYARNIDIGHESDVLDILDIAQCHCIEKVLTMR